MTAMAASIAIVSAERVRDELTKLLLAPAPRAGLRLLVDSGLADHVLPELPALQLEIDEHHRHKDVYEHSLTVLDQAIALEGPPDGPESSVPGPDLVLRLAALLHDIGKPATRRFESGGGVSFHHHEVVGAKLDRQAAQGAALRQGHRQGGDPAGRAAPAVPRLRRRRVDRLGRAPLRHRRRAAAPAAAPAHPLGLHDPQRPQGRPAVADLRRARGADRGADGGRGAGQGAARAQRQRDRRGARHPARARCSAAPTPSCSSCGSTRAWSAATPPRPRCGSGGPSSRSRAHAGRS